MNEMTISRTTTKYNHTHSLCIRTTFVFHFKVLVNMRAQVLAKELRGNGERTVVIALTVLVDGVECIWHPALVGYLRGGYKTQTRRQCDVKYRTSMGKSQSDAKPGAAPLNTKHNRLTHKHTSHKTDVTQNRQETLATRCSNTQ